MSNPHPSEFDTVALTSINTLTCRTVPTMNSLLREQQATMGVPQAQMNGVGRRDVAQPPMAPAGRY